MYSKLKGSAKMYKFFVIFCGNGCNQNIYITFIVSLIFKGIYNPPETSTKYYCYYEQVYLMGYKVHFTLSGKNNEKVAHRDPLVG